MGKGRGSNRTLEKKVCIGDRAWSFGKRRALQGVEDRRAWKVAYQVEGGYSPDY